MSAQTTVVQMKPHAPLLNETEASQLVLDSYVLLVHSTKCACGTESKWSTLNEVWIHPTKTALTGFRNLRPTTTIDPKLDLSYIIEPTRATPLCHSCITSYKTNLFVQEVLNESNNGGASQIDQTPIPSFISHAAWAETLKRKAVVQTSTRPQSVTPAAKHVPSLKDL